MRRTTLLITGVASVAIVAMAAAQMLPLAKEPAWKIRDVAEEAEVSSSKVEEFLGERTELRRRLLRTKGNIALARLELEEVFEGDEVDAGDAEAKLEKLLDLPIVGDVRGDGYFYGIELVKDKATKETFDDDESERLLRGYLSTALFDAGLVCRADDRGDPVIQLAPPLICTQQHFDEIEQILRATLTEAWSRI